jgi:hypothetical protein
MCIVLLPPGVNPIAVNKYIKTSYGFQEHLHSPNFKRHTKCIFYRTLIRPLLTHGSECWTLSMEEGNMILANNQLDALFIYFTSLHVSSSKVLIIRRSIVLIHHLVRINSIDLLMISTVLLDAPNL